MPTPCRARRVHPGRGRRLSRTVCSRSLGPLAAALLVSTGSPLARADQGGPAAPPAIVGDRDRSSNNGAALFELDVPPGTPVVVQLDTDPDFSRPRQVYAGALPAAYVSGLRDGRYHLRAGRDDSTTTWSAPVTLTVAHHPTSRVWPALGLGLLTFLATLGVLLEGRRRSMREISGRPEGRA